MKSNTSIRIISFILSFSISYFLIAQAPVSQIEGYLEVSHPVDTTSMYIGVNAGQKNSTLGFQYQTFIGSLAGQLNDTGVANTFVGSKSGRSNTEGSSNSFFGHNSGHQNTSGFSNSFFGQEAGFSNSTGRGNSFFGQGAGLFNTAEQDNCYFGDGAGLATKGNSNSFFGKSSGGGFLVGNNNSNFGVLSGTRIDTGSYNICIGSSAGPENRTSLSQRLFIDVVATDDPLIYGEFDNDLIRINGDLEVIKNIQIHSNSLSLHNLGDADNGKGVIWNETVNPVFGLVYDGEGTGGNNRLHLREFIDAPSDIVTYKANGNVGISESNPLTKLHIVGGPDATVSGGGYILMGNKTGTNIVMDDNEIMARNNNATSTLHLNANGGDVKVGGTLIIHDDSASPAVAGQMRYNSTSNDFEGYNGTAWRSLTGKTEHEIFIGPGQFYFNHDASAEVVDFNYATGVSRNEDLTTIPKEKIIPLTLPVGSIITQVVYFYKEDLPDAKADFSLIKYDITNGPKVTVGYEFSTDVNNTPIGWTSAATTETQTIEAFKFYAFNITNDGTGLTNSEDLLQFKGIRVTYTLP